MGGPGSGRWALHGKAAAVDDGLRLDIAALTRTGDLHPGRTGTITWSVMRGRSASVQFAIEESADGNRSIVLSYACRAISVEESIPLATSTPNYGGIRWWLLCPLVRNGTPCHRRQRVLYLSGGATHFGCRECHGLTYISCQESHKFDRLYRDTANRLGVSTTWLKAHFG